MKNFKQYITEANTREANLFLQQLKNTITENDKILKYEWVLGNKNANDIIQENEETRQSIVLARRIIPDQFRSHFDNLKEFTLSFGSEVGSKYINFYDNLEYTTPITLRLGAWIDNPLLFPFRMEHIYSQHHNTNRGFIQYISGPGGIVEIEEYNFYESLEGSPVEKAVKFIEEIEMPQRKKTNYWADELNSKYLALKRKAYGDESLSTDDWIDMGMSDI